MKGVIKMKMSNNVYDWLKWIAQVLLPALGTLYAALGAALGLGNVDVVVSIIMAVDAFMGALLGLSTSKYNKELAASAATARKK